MSYHVFIERASDDSPGATDKVASAISSRYGLPQAAIAQRMAKGRFRVKANVDLKTAAKFAADLEKLGAVCTIVDASAGGQAPTAVNAPGAPGVAAAAAGAASKPPAIPSAPPRARAPAKAAKDQTAAAPPAAEPAPAAAGGAGEYQTGLAAAFSASSDAAPQNLGALESLESLKADTGEFKLSSLDGADDVGAAQPAESASFGPDASAFAPPDAEAEGALQLADVSQSDDAPAPPAPSNVGGGPVEDLFAPPDIDDQLLETVEVVQTNPMPSITAPSAPAASNPVCPTHGAFDGKIYVRCPACASAEAGAGGADHVAVASTGKSVSLPDFKVLFRERFLDSERTRFAVGVFVIILLSWIPAKIFWGAQVDSAQAELNASMQEPRSLASSEPDSWEEYNEVGRAQKQIRESSLFNTKITASLIWIACGAGLGFVWFRKIPWDDF